MTAFVALLRAVNVGGTGKLPMTELKAFCEEAGFAKVTTFISSGNVLFESRKSEAAVRAVLEQRLARYAGKSVGVLVRTAAEMADVLRSNPFPDAAPNRTVAIFLEGAPPRGVLDTLSGREHEEVRAGKREIYVFYRDGIPGSKLKIPAAKSGTARNMNTVAKLAGLLAARSR